MSPGGEDAGDTLTKMWFSLSHFTWFSRKMTKYDQLSSLSELTLSLPHRTFGRLCKEGGICLPRSPPGSLHVTISLVTNCPSRYLETDGHRADCQRCHLSLMVAVGRVDFTQPKCEVTVRYCDKIEQGRSYSREFCWQESGTLIRARICNVSWTPTARFPFCVRGGKTAVASSKSWSRCCLE